MRIMASSDSVYGRLLGQFKNRVQERVQTSSRETSGERVKRVAYACNE
jgi:hypothetical protein